MNNHNINRNIPFEALWRPVAPVIYKTVALTLGCLGLIVYFVSEIILIRSYSNPVEIQAVVDINVSQNAYASYMWDGKPQYGLLKTSETLEQDQIITVMVYVSHPDRPFYKYRGTSVLTYGVLIMLMLPITGLLVWWLIKSIRYIKLSYKLCRNGTIAPAKIISRNKIGFWYEFSDDKQLHRHFSATQWDQANGKVLYDSQVPSKNIWINDSLQRVLNDY